VRVQKRLFMSFQWKFGHRHSILWPWFLYRERYYGDLKTFSVDFLHWICCMSAIFLFPVYLTYWQGVSHVCFSPNGGTFHWVRSWYDLPLPPVIAFLLQIGCITLWPWPLIFWPFNLGQWSYMAGYMVNSTPPPCLKILRLSVLELSVLTSPIGYHWQCVCSQYACTMSHDLCVWGKFFPYIWNPWPRFIPSL